MSPRPNSSATAATTPSRPTSGVRGRGSIGAAWSVIVASAVAPGRAAARSAARASPPRPNAAASSTTVPRRGVRVGARSRSLTAFGLTRPLGQGLLGEP